MEQPEDVQHIIVVDDDECVRETLEIALAGAGHSVRATERGSEALQWLDEEPCHLLIMDLKMPEIDGPALYKQVLTRWPMAAPRVLFVSGYADLGPYHDDPMVRGVPVLFKPFTLSDLFSAVHRALATSSHVGL
jgi:DNA-binding NtrC family response regulator